MSKAVRYDEFGGIDVLRVDEVERPVPGDGQVLVRVKAAGINPSEAAIRSGAVAQIFPSTFPSGQGSDLAGVIEEVGAGVGGFSPGDEVIGFTQQRASQAELALVEACDLTRKPEKVSWEVAGGLYVVGVTAWGAVHAVQAREGETVVISGAAGGVGSLAAQLARRTGATVIGLASEGNHEWLKSHGVIPVAYGDGVADRVRAAAPSGVDAFVDTHGGGYVELALALGVAAERIDTIADFAAAAKHGVKTDGGERGRAGRQGARRAGRPDRRRTARGADCECLPAGTGPRGLHRARTQSHPRQDRPQALAPLRCGWRPSQIRSRRGSARPHSSAAMSAGTGTVEPWNPRNGRNEASAAVASSSTLSSGGSMR